MGLPAPVYVVSQANMFRVGGGLGRSRQFSGRRSLLKVSSPTEMVGSCKENICHKCPSQPISNLCFAPVAISHMKQFGVELDNYVYVSNPDNANACSRCYRRTMAGLLPCRLADGKIFGNRLGSGAISTACVSLHYLMAATPALHTTSSCESVPPEQPIAPINFPCSISGIPPREATIPSNVIK